MEPELDASQYDSRPCRTFPEREPQELTIADDDHYTASEIAKTWHISPNTVRKIFADEPGVFRYASEERSRNPRKRRMVQLRIPRRVALRVHARLSN